MQPILESIIVTALGTQNWKSLLKLIIKSYCNQLELLYKEKIQEFSITWLAISIIEVTIWSDSIFLLFSKNILTILVVILKEWWPLLIVMLEIEWQDVLRTLIIHYNNITLRNLRLEGNFPPQKKSQQWKKNHTKRQLRKIFDFQNILCKREWHTLLLVLIIDWLYAVIYKLAFPMNPFAFMTEA